MVKTLSRRWTQKIMSSRGSITELTWPSHKVQSPEGNRPSTSSWLNPSTVVQVHPEPIRPPQRVNEARAYYAENLKRHFGQSVPAICKGIELVLADYDRNTHAAPYNWVLTERNA